jgi:hypothetical protein
LPTHSPTAWKFSGEEQKTAKIAALDLQLNPAHPGLQFDKLEKAKDKQFCSIRVNLDLRIIVHRTPIPITTVVSRVGLRT